MIPKKTKIDLKDLQILEALGDGETVKRTAAIIGLHSQTVTWRIRWMKKKYKCNSIAQLIKKSALLKVTMKA